MAPLGAQAADLVVWWEEGYYAQEDEAVAEIIAFTLTPLMKALGLPPRL